MRAANPLTMISRNWGPFGRRRRPSPWRAAVLDRLPVRVRSARRSAPLADLRHRADDAAHNAAAAARHAASVTAQEARRRASRAPVGPLGLVAACLAAGAALMYLLDPSSGKRRRARVRDRLAHMRRVVARDVPGTVRRRGRFIGGVAKGVRHDAAELIPHHHARVGDDTLVARVRSEVLRDERYKAGEIHVDAYEGCVTLRGQLERDEDIRDIVERARRVEGVAEVRSYLHLPGTPPPNKAEAYNGHVPAHMAR